MRLYIANVTNQTKGVQYRDSWNVPGGGRAPFRAPRTVNIPPGRQLPVGGDSDLPTIEEVVRQLTPYGMVAVTDMKRLGRKQRVTLIFNTDGPVPKPVMEAAKAHNRGILTTEGKDRRTAAAVAANEALIGQVAALNETRDGDHNQVNTPREVDTEFEQMDEIEGADDPHVEQGIKVVNDGSGRSPSPGRRGRPPRAQAA